jgi:hypothetical protein
LEVGRLWAGLADKRLGHLDPVTVAVILLDGAGRLANVDLSRAGVLHTTSTESLAKTNNITGLDGVDLRVGTRGVGLATEVVRGSSLLLEGRHVSTAVLTDVLPVTANHLTVDGQTRERVVSSSKRQSRNSGCGSGEAHDVV